jgi:hypothetical protein
MSDKKSNLMGTFLSRRTLFSILIVFIHFPLMLHASEAPSQQLQTRKNSLFVELLGNGGIYSGNYERAVRPSLGIRCGFAYYIYFADGSKEADTGAMVPLMMNYRYGSEKHGLEIGLGVSLVFPTGNVDVGVFDKDTRLVGTATIGYRNVEPGGKLFRVGFTPFFGKRGLTPWFGASFGLVF